jgi:hypothetical protein
VSPFGGGYGYGYGNPMGGFGLGYGLGALNSAGSSMQGKGIKDHWIAGGAE